ncbi:telomere repeats-binding bouquet formation protein 1 [Diretmus argenteus]
MDVVRNLNTIKTDLSSLLDCLKFQMRCPDMQKQALLTINSICEKREAIVDLLREMGGLVFIYSIYKSSIAHSDVKQMALYTLGTLAETSVHCKNYLCIKETFSDLADCLIKEDTPQAQRRVAVYLLSILVANNKSGQTFAQTTGCIGLLLDLFRTSFPLSTETTLQPVNSPQTYQLWKAVSSALCGCVSDPQNEEGQRICVVAFPMVKTWLQQMTLPLAEIFQPVCTFIATTVANNSCAQESFSASGGLETLTLTLVRLASNAEKSLVCCQLSVILTKTLAACIADNSVLAPGLAQYGVVRQLLSLLSSPNLDPQDRLPVVVSLSYCTVASEEHQSQLVQCGGLPSIITLLTESTSKEVRSAATSILQSCKQATMSLGVPGLRGTQGEVGTVESVTNMDGYWRSAREFLCSINQLEEVEYKQGHVGSTTPTTELGPPSLPPRQEDTIEVWLRGCVLGCEVVPSRTFAALQSSCHHSCDMHKVLQEATERFRARHHNPSFGRERQECTVEQIDPHQATPEAEPQRSRQYCREFSPIRLTPIWKAGQLMSSVPAKRLWKDHNGTGVSLTPLCKRADMERFTSHNSKATQRKRKDFTHDEVCYLLSGVKKYGFSWNSILSAYPFQPGRTDVTLAEKYRQLMKTQAKDLGCT